MNPVRAIQAAQLKEFCDTVGWRILWGFVVVHVVAAAALISALVLGRKR